MILDAAINTDISLTFMLSLIGVGCSFLFSFAYIKFATSRHEKDIEELKQIASKKANKDYVDEQIIKRDTNFDKVFNRLNEIEKGEIKTSVMLCNILEKINENNEYIKMLIKQKQ